MKKSRSDSESLALERASRLFRSLGDLERLQLLAFLSRGESCVSEIALATGAGLSTVSQRLRVLRSDGLVSRRREGKHVYYRLSDAHVKQLIRNAVEHSAEPKTARGRRG